MGWNEMGWDGMGWDGIGPDGPKNLQYLTFEDETEV